jgi:hypothetical protein
MLRSSIFLKLSLDVTGACSTIIWYSTQLNIHFVINFTLSELTSMKNVILFCAHLYEATFLLFAIDAIALSQEVGHDLSCVSGYGGIT